MKRIALFIPLVLLGACGQGGPSYMPLVEGREWSYSEKSSFQDNVPTIKIGKKISVGGFEGRELKSELGESRLAWNGKKLVASMLANTTFNPPIPLLLEDKIPEKKKSREEAFIPADVWSGSFESLGKRRNAKATLSQRRSTVQLLTGETEVVETVLLVQIEGTKDGMPLELRTWFERGVGIVRQEQRTNRNHVVGIEKLESK